MRKKLVTFAFFILCNFPTFGQIDPRDLRLPAKGVGYFSFGIIILLIVIIIVIMLIVLVVFRRKSSKNKSGVCANCGQEIKEGAKFCTKCGTKIL